MSATLTLSAGQCSVELSAAGGETWAWRIGGKDMIWHGDEAFWPRRAPILFPFCGWLNNLQFRAKGKSYPTDVHGFGRTAPFAMEKRSANTARMVLADSPETLAQFPYRFRLTVDVTVSETGFAYDFAVENPGDEVLPFSLGYHPGFLWPFDGGARNDYRLVFDGDERIDAVRTALGGLFMAETYPLPMRGGALDLARAFAVQDSLIIRDSLTSQVDFIAPTGRRIRVATRNFPNWVIWTKPGAGYLCIERWSGEGDPVDFAGEIVDKPGMTLLPPGETRHFAFACDFL